jgi:hypothetical protein
MGRRKVDFLTAIQRDRLRKRKRQPFQPTLFARISAIVREHRLTGDFVARLDAVDAGVHVDVDTIVRGEKKPLIVPLYSLVGEDEYRVTRGILERMSNPYLPYAQSPEDILLSGTLFSRDPDLTPQRLSRWDFKTLLACAHAKEEMQEILARGETGTGTDGPSLPGVARERLERLKTFIASVESD